MNISAQISIGRISNDTISIVIEDESSRVKFLTIHMIPHDFAMALTGLSSVEVQAEVKNLVAVGKQKVSENRCVFYTGENKYDRKVIQEWLIATQQEQGWIMDSYIGSQSSIQHIDDKVKVNYRVYKYV